MGKASQMGAYATITLLESTCETETKVICLNDNKIVKLSLMECVKKTMQVAEAIDQKDFSRALDFRGPYVCKLILVCNFWSQ